MKREFLTELGIEEETIDKIMTEHGKTVNPLKDDRDSLTSKVETLNTQLEERDTQLEELGDKATGHDDLKAQIDSLKQANEEAKESFNKKIEQQQFDFALDKSLMEAKARNPVTVKALLDLDTIKLGDDGQLIGLSEQLDQKKESDWYLFEDNETDHDDVPTGGNNHVPGSKKKSNKPKDKDPYELGRLKAMERHKLKGADEE